MRAEAIADALRERHGLTTIHIFTAKDGWWRAFGFREDPKGYQASVENGEGTTIEDALVNLDVRLKEGPIHRRPT